MIPYWFVELIAGLVLFFIAIAIYKDIKKAKVEKKRKLIITWGIILVIGGCLFLAVSINKNYLYEKLGWSLYSQNDIPLENQQNIERLFPTP